ncbi:MAG: hypothetical protein K940chlam5_00628 [Candidatus Anoxychlamydiales bacterium]|nr:hypothetical protein [Candidatus Anoxychlamydiales bacterium]
MVTSIMAKPFEALAHVVDKVTYIEDKVKDFAKKTFSSIKNITFANIKNVPSKIFNFVKENKFNLVLATLSLAISAAVFVYVSPTATILFLGAVSFVKAIAYTREYVKSNDYKFRKVAKSYIKSIEDICRNHKNGQTIGNDITTGKIYKKFNVQQLELIDLLYCAKDKSQLNGWKKYLKEINPNLQMFSRSFPKFLCWKKLNDKVFETYLYISVDFYIAELFNFVDEEEKSWFKKEVEDLAKDLNPQSHSLKKEILSKLSTIEDSFLEGSTKKAIALEVYREIIVPDIPQPTDADRTKKSSYTIFKFMKNLSPLLSEED